MRSRNLLVTLGLFLSAGILIWLAALVYSGKAAAADSVQIKGLLAPARIVTDSNYIPHIFADNDHDAMLLLGYVHARDRFFQMDLLRRQASGTTAELLGIRQTCPSPPHMTSMPASPPRCIASGADRS